MVTLELWVLWGMIAPLVLTVAGQFWALRLPVDWFKAAVLTATVLDFMAVVAVLR
jgi:hypothetical protein